MTQRLHNFSAGPAALPLEVLQEAQRNLVDHEGCGLSVMEMSHRSKEFDGIFQAARQEILDLHGLSSEEWEVLLLQGGASLQFAMVPLNLGSGGAYVNTGAWSKKALAEAKVIGEASEIWTDAERNFKGCPGPDAALELPAGSAYLHYTSNNTIFGTQFQHVPEVQVPLVCDMSSDFMSRPLPMDRFDLIYAGAQKNAGPSGVTVVLGRKRILREYNGAQTTPKILRYATHAEKDSLFNTPNTFGAYLLLLVARWVREQGGLGAVAEANAAKAKRLYDIIDQRADVFEGHADADSRSDMNVTFRLKDESRNEALLAAAAEAKISGIKGHRSVGGFRASIYNAVPAASVEALAKLLESF